MDSSSILGTGHLGRCLVIGAALANKGATVTFLCREEPGAATELARAQGFAVSPVNACIDRRKTAAFSLSDSFCEATDAIQTIGSLPPKIDCLVVDHYSCGKEWERAVRQHCRYLAVIDDLAREHACDVLIDPNWHGSKTDTRYTGRLEPETRALLGPDYALLHPAFAACRFSPTDRHKDVARVLVYFGGSDLQGLTSLALTTLSRPEFAHLEVDIVIGATNLNDSLIERQPVDNSRVRIHHQQDSLAPLLVHADLAIGAVGGTTWERMCLGVPSLAVIVADNQAETAHELASAGLIDLLGWSTEVTEHMFASHLRTLLADADRRQRMADAGQTLVDGRGAERVVDALFHLVAS